MTTPGATWPASRAPGWHVRVVEQTGSTNADLLADAGRGAPDRSVLMARYQSAGRGRLDRRWDAPPGANLLVSVLFRHPPDHAHQLTQRIALAAVAACRRVADVDAVLKWPNDVLLEGRKLAGVLAQSGATGAERYVVVGIGLNVGWAPPEGASLGTGIDPADVLEALLAEYDRLPADITARYRARLATIGSRVRVSRTADTVVGRAIGVEPDGRLMVLDDCGITHRIDTGDVVHLRPDEPSPGEAPTK